MKARGQLNKQIGHVADLMPTCLELAGASYPKSYRGKALKPLDGTSLLPVLNGQAAAERVICWEHRGHRAVRRGRWKLVAAHTETWQLYDMAADRTETEDLSKRHPQVVASLSKEYDHWARRCDVVPWDDLDVPFIPPSDNPLTRTEAELEVYFQALRERGLTIPGSDRTQP